MISFFNKNKFRNSILEKKYSEIEESCAIIITTLIGLRNNYAGKLLKNTALTFDTNEYNQVRLKFENLQKITGTQGDIAQKINSEIKDWMQVKVLINELILEYNKNKLNIYEAAKNSSTYENLIREAYIPLISNLIDLFQKFKLEQYEKLVLEDKSYKLGNEKNFEQKAA